MARWTDNRILVNIGMAESIVKGASRTLVLHERDERHIVEAMKQDLAHIYGLFVIGASVSGRNMHVSLASIKTAIQARTCLKSQ